MKVTDEECEDYARECVRLANLTADPILREKLMQMARDWMAVAMHEERLGRTARKTSADA